MHDVAVDVRQPVVASLMAIGQSFVIDAEEVETGGVEVVSFFPGVFWATQDKKVSSLR